MEKINKIKKIRNISELFILFCFVGWIYEVIWCNLIENNIGWQNNGFLFGPWLPIYGFGMSLVLIIFKRYKIEAPGKIFLSGTLIVTVVELIGGYITKLTINKVFWDYSDLFGNFQGIIAIKTSIMFGLLILLGIYVILPRFQYYQDKLNNNIVRNIISTSIIILFIIDVLLRIKLGSNI